MYTKSFQKLRDSEPNASAKYQNLVINENQYLEKYDHTFTPHKTNRQGNH